jgi:hypothetical protein
VQTIFKWLDLHRRVADAIPDDVSIALLTSRAGAAGLSLDQLRRKSGLAFNVLDVLLARLLARGQLIILVVNGERVFRAGV